MGASVRGVDIAEPLLTAARELSADIRPPIDFQRGDAERLPFGDGAFDGVISTFGVMFAADQMRAARELGRVCRPGGRLVLAAWTPTGKIADFFGIMAAYSEVPPPPASPLAWGDPAHVQDLLGGAFELTFERGVSHAYYASALEIWDWYVRGFGPLRQLADGLAADRAEALKRDVDAFHRCYAGPAGLHVERDYLLTIEWRR